MYKLQKVFVIFSSIAIIYSLFFLIQLSSSPLIKLFENAFGQVTNDNSPVSFYTVDDFNLTTGKLISGLSSIEYNGSNILGLQNVCPPQAEIALYIYGFLINGKTLGSVDAIEIFDKARCH